MVVLCVINTSDDAETGYIVTVDFEFDREIHSKLKEFPPAPENIKPDIEWFSHFQKQIGIRTGAVSYIKKWKIPTV